MSRLKIRRCARIVPTPAVAPEIRRIFAARRNARLRIFMTESAMQQVWRAVDLMHGLLERGGALAGSYCIDPQARRFIVITDVLPALNAPAWRAHIEIRPEDWIDIYRRLERLDGKRLLGWYHSHPGLGLRMSWTDRETQRLVFHADWQVGLVVDPCHHTFRFYRGPKARRAQWIATTELTDREGPKT